MQVAIAITLTDEERATLTKRSRERRWRKRFVERRLAGIEREHEHAAGLAQGAFQRHRGCR